MQSKAEKKEKRNRKRTEERRSRRRDDLPEDEQTDMCVCFRYRCSPRARRRRRCFPNGRECPAGRTFDQQSGMKRCWPEQNIQSKREGNKRKIGFKFSGFFFPHFTKKSLPRYFFFFRPSRTALLLFDFRHFELNSLYFSHRHL